jgi:hypothetical protein
VVGSFQQEGGVVGWGSLLLRTIIEAMIEQEPRAETSPVMAKRKSTNPKDRRNLTMIFHVGRVSYSISGVCLKSCMFEPQIHEISIGIQRDSSELTPYPVKNGLM